MTQSTHTKKYKKLQVLLIEARKGKGLTQADVAANLSKPQSYVSKYESGERRIDLIEFLEIVEVLKLDPNVFIRKLIK